MGQFSSYFKNRRVWIAIAVPFALQAVFFLIMLPALRGSQTRIDRLHLAIVSEDAGLGNQIAAQIAGKLPFAVDRPANLSAARAEMSAGTVQMIVDFPRNFTQELRQGGSAIDFTIDPAASLSAREIMTQAAQTIAAQVNAVAFGEAEGAIRRAIGENLNGMPLPPQAAAGIASGVGQAIQALKPELVRASISGGGQDASPFGALVPLFVVLLGFVGSVGAIALLWSSPATGNRWALFGQLQLVLAAVAVVLPGITLGSLALFGQTFTGGVFGAWWPFTIDYWAMLLFVAALARLNGPAGLSLSGLTIPLQIVSAGVLLPSQLLPGFYSWSSQLTPGPYAAQGALRIISGVAVPASDVRNVLIIAAAALLVGAVGAFIPRKKLSALG